MERLSPENIPVLSDHARRIIVRLDVIIDAAGEDDELVLLNREDWSYDASDRAAAWLASLAEKPPLPCRLVPETIRPWVAARRAKFAQDDLARAPQEIALPVDDGATLIVRHLFAGRETGRDALLLGRLTPASAAPLDDFGLTRREAEILMAAAGGLTNRELGERFSISERTVEKHFSHIYQKLGVKTRTAAVSVALRGTAGRATALRGVN